MMTNFSLHPLLRQSIGFDRFNDLFESALQSKATPVSYPPYNIEKHGEDGYAIVMAVAGFQEKDLDIMMQNNRLTVKGSQSDKEEAQDVSYLHRGIANRSFECVFSVADNVQVQHASLKDGLLRIDLKHIVPEAAKPRMIPINSHAALETTEAAAKPTKR